MVFAGHTIWTDDRELQARNQRAWNRYMSQWLKEGNQGPHSAEDRTPFSVEELAEVKKAFLERHRSEASTAVAIIPELKAGDQIDFSDVDFNWPFQADGFFFSDPSNFGGATFSVSASFRGASFSDGAAFAGASFSFADFNGATFFGPADFRGATFSGPADFQGVTFYGVADFTGASFFFVDFRGATFSGPAFFGNRAVFLQAVFLQGTTFSGAADFPDVTFSSFADFTGATFSGAADFTDATFSSSADFAVATFCDDAYFQGAIFRSTISFVNGEMKGPTSFEAATFSVEPPRFFGAKLHEGTVWRQIRWPIPTSGADDAGSFVDAYERLKLEMDRLKKHEDELDFFALELRSRRVLSGIFRGLPIALYGLLCNYGLSYVRPLAGVFVTIAAGAVAYLPHFGLSQYPRAVGLSLANTFGVLGFRKDFIDPHVIETLSRALKVVSAVQSVVGIVLFFLFGLALRNRFRMR